MTKEPPKDNIIITNEECSGFFYGKITLEMLEVYITDDKGKTLGWLEPNEIVERIDNEYGFYLLCGTFSPKCEDPRDEAIIKLYCDAFSKTIEEGNMDTDIRAAEMIIRTVLGKDAHYW